MDARKSLGTTASERYLAQLCEKSFLHLWSYPNLFRDQGKENGGDGKELCDLLVVCGDDVIIFSDKSCVYCDTRRPDVDWCRWYGRAIQKSANQIFGAERWIRNFPERLFLNSRCTEPLPLRLPASGSMRVYRVVVALGAKEACRRFSGGSGSLTLNPSVIDNAHCCPTDPVFSPFQVGIIASGRGFVHVFDDVTLDILLKELDTITDFIAYLKRKEALIQNGQLAVAFGEENLLAYYLRHVDRNGEHGFVLPRDNIALAIAPDGWSGLKTTPSYQRKRQADEISYVWDELIQKFGKHILNGSLVGGSSNQITDHERAPRVMAQEPRVRRRALANSLLDAVRGASFGQTFNRVVVSPTNDQVAYVFVIMPFEGTNYDEYRTRRRIHLANYCQVFGWKHKHYQQIVGIATEPGDSEGRSFELMLFQPDGWTPELDEEARQIQDALGIQREENVRRQVFRTMEYPRPRIDPRALSRKVGRNELCPCGSGLKYKRCCGSAPD